jgi:hypothetical protein
MPRFLSSTKIRILVRSLNSWKALATKISYDFLPVIYLNWFPSPDDLDEVARDPPHPRGLAELLRAIQCAQSISYAARSSVRNTNANPRFPFLAPTQPHNLGLPRQDLFPFLRSPLRFHPVSATAFDSPTSSFSSNPDPNLPSSVFDLAR